MEPVRDILIKNEKAYKNSIELKGGVKILLADSIKQVKDTIRYGEVMAVPEECPIDVKVGDTLFFHHNIVGVTVMDDNHADLESAFLVDKDRGIYRVPVDLHWPLVYAIIRDGEIQTLPGVCFVRPIFDKKYDTFIEIPGNEKEVRHIGEIVYGNKDLEDLGVEEGSKVIFTRNSEYQFEINGETLYCMFSRWIVGLYE